MGNQGTSSPSDKGPQRPMTEEAAAVSNRDVVLLPVLLLVPASADHTCAGVLKETMLT